jgi:hypothetical protein
MDQLSGLVLYGTHHVGVTMAGRADRNTRIEVEEPIAVDILYDRAAGTLRN